MSCRTLAYGLVFGSNLPLPGCRCAPGDSPVDIDIDLRPGHPPSPPADDETRLRTLPAADPDEPPLLQVRYSTSDRTYRFRYADGTEFVISAAADTVEVTWPDPLTLEDAATYLLGPVLGFILRLRGRVCLHASAVAVADGAVAFLAPPGFGKSTLAALFATWGHQVVTDDILVLLDDRPRIHLQPGLPRLCLWPAAVKLLFGRTDALPRITPTHPTWDKRYLELNDGAGRFQEEPLPLRAVYTPRPAFGASRLKIEPVSGHAALMTLTANAYSWYLLDRTMRARDLDLMSRLLADVPLRAIRGGSREQLSLEDLGRMILRDLESLPAGCGKRP